MATVYSVVLQYQVHLVKCQWSKDLRMSVKTECYILDNIVWGSGG